MRDFRKLHTWQHGHALTLAIYSASASIPRTGYPGLTSQLRRSAAAVPTNLAEGCCHTSRREFARFVQVALASTVETEYHLQLCHDLGVIDPQLATQLITDCNRLRQMLAALLAKVRAELNTSPDRFVPPF